MFKRSLLFIQLIFSSLLIFSQDLKKEVPVVKTKMEVFTSRTGTITKLTDYSLPRLKTSYASVETRVRKVSSGLTPTYFYQIEKEGKYNNTTASIEYSDLLEVIKALKSLKTEVDKDLVTNPDYLENKFITVDGFQVGYFIIKGKASWYITLEKFGSDNTLFIDNGDTIETAFTTAKDKIDELKK